MCNRIVCLTELLNLYFFHHRAKAEPVLEAARLALENIEKGQLTELKSFASPPETVKFVMNMVGKYLTLEILIKLVFLQWYFSNGLTEGESFLKINAHGLKQKIPLDLSKNFYNV
jgi:hypothetical protein